MSEKSRDEKLAAAKKKLKKFQTNNTKDKHDKSKNNHSSIPNNQVREIKNNLHLVQSENNECQTNNTDLSVYMNKKDVEVAILPTEEPTITTESLKHISRHLNGIISCSSSSIDRESQIEYMNTIRDLEKRNIELASLNSQKADQIETFLVKIKNLNDAIERLNQDRVQELSNLESSFKRQLDSNKDQFQAQIHTISLLVAEKSELQSQVTHNQKVLVQRQQENEDITNKLKVLRQKVGDLEKMLSDLKTKNDKLEEAYRDVSHQSEQMRNTLKKLKSEKEDSLSECSQLRSRLMSKTQEVSNLELTLDDVKSHLEMSQVQIQHLTNSQENHYDSMYSQLKLTEKKNLELMENVESLKLQIQQSDSQSSRVQSQYRNYFEQMEEKIKVLQTELSRVMEERNVLSLELDSLKRNISEINHTEVVDVSYLQNSISNLQNREDQFIENIHNLESMIKVLTDKSDSLSRNNEQLAQVNNDLEEKNIDLMDRVNQLEANKVDHIDLLQQLQSDKTALSRSLAQNKQLKSQLIELQEAFVKLSSDNMDLSTTLDHEKHISKELSLRLGEQEDELCEIRQIVGTKDEEIARLIQSNKQITEDLLTTNNSPETGHLQRSESHFNMANKELISNLQTDISHLQERINKLTTENNQLRYQSTQRADDEISSNTKIQDISSVDQDNAINIGLLQLQSERDELLAKCEAYNIRESELLILLDNFKAAKDENDVIVTKEMYESLQILQISISETNAKYSEIMEQNCRLIEENSRLEHIVEQLEGETDTIGEYISLYQHQRSMLKQRSVAKDQFMSKLVHQKQLLDRRLLTLEQLVVGIDLAGEGRSEDPPECGQRQKSSLGQIFAIIDELKRPSDHWLHSLERGVAEEGRDGSESIGDSFNDESLFHSQFIHCKCCVGKVIDL